MISLNFCVFRIYVLANHKTQNLTYTCLAEELLSIIRQSEGSDSIYHHLVPKHFHSSIFTFSSPTQTQVTTQTQLFIAFTSMPMY